VAALPGFRVPNDSSSFADTQSELHEADLQTLALGLQLTGVVSGCAVTAQGTPDMTVAVAAGSVIVDGVLATVSSGNVTITTADATNPRYDLVVVDNAGAKSVTAGTAAANPDKPDVPADRAVLAEVLVLAADTTIETDKIVDKRVFIANWFLRLQPANLYYYYPNGPTTPVAHTLNDLVATPIWLPGGITVDRLGVEVTTAVATAVYRLGIYRDAGGIPGALLVDGGTVDCSTTGNKTVTISQAINDPGLYWLAGSPQVAVATIRGITHAPGLLALASGLANPPATGGHGGYSRTGVSGALPDPFAGTLTPTSSSARVFARVT
jgi:hypothetical protein